MAYHTENFVLKDTTRLSLTCWRAVVGSSLPPVLLVHGYGEHIGRYQHVIDLLNQHGFEVWGYDARGHGHSGGLVGYIPTIDALPNDCAQVFEYVAAQTGRTPIVVGHSMGGLTAALAVALQKIRPAALVLSSPALRLFMNPMQKALLAVGLCLFKTKPIKSPAVEASFVARAPLVVAQYKNDPLVHQMISPLFVQYMKNGGDLVRERAAHFEMPVLLIYAGSDKIIDPTGSDDLAARLPVHATSIRYGAAYHEIFNEPEAERQVVLTQMMAWLKQKVG